MDRVWVDAIVPATGWAPHDESLVNAGTPMTSKLLSPVAARLLNRAQQETRSGNAKAAMRTMISALALAPDNVEALRWTGIAAQNCGDHVGAVDCFRRALAATPDDPDLHIGLGVALYRLGHEAEALMHLRRACDLAPDSASAWYNLAEGLKPQVQTEAAIEALQRTLTIDPEHVPARLALVRAQISLGRIDDAAAGLREILRRRPQDADAWFALADLKTVTCCRRPKVDPLLRVLPIQN